MWFLFALTAPFFLSLTNILDSLIMNTYERRPVVYLFYAGTVMTCMLFVFALFVDIRSTWILPIILTSILGYVGDLWYFRALGRIDVSVVNAAWAILAIVISIGGFAFFGERWTLLQSAGAVVVLGGILFLSYYHADVSIVRTMGLFLAMSLFLAPMFLTQKAAILAGDSAVAVAYWRIMGSNIPNILVPVFRREWREGVRTLPSRVHADFFLVLPVVILLWFAGTYAVMRAYETGFVSLVSIVGNVQPFFVIGQSWLIAKALPRYAPRELLTAQSVGVKLTSFAVVFVGLALLAMG